MTDSKATSTRREHGENDVLAGAPPEALENLARLSTGLTNTMAIAATPPHEIIRSLNDQGPMTYPTYLIARHVKSILMRESENGFWPQNMKRGVSARVVIYALLGMNTVRNDLEARGLSIDDIDVVRQQTLDEARNYDLYASDGSDILLDRGVTNFTEALLYEEPLAALMTKLQHEHEMLRRLATAANDDIQRSGLTLTETLYRIIADPEVQTPESLANLNLSSDVTSTQAHLATDLTATLIGNPDEERDAIAEDVTLVSDFTRSQKPAVNDFAKLALDFLSTEDGQQYVVRPIGVEMALRIVLENQEISDLVSSSEINVPALKAQCLMFHGQHDGGESERFNKTTATFGDRISASLREAASDPSISSMADLFDFVLLNTAHDIPPVLVRLGIEPGMLGVASAGSTHLHRPAALTRKL